MHFSNEFITSLKQKIPVEQLIGKYVNLKKQGDHLVGLCPFHDDHNPSFTVFPNTQSFYCFGCQAGSKSVTKSSDHIAFLMAYHKIAFPKAVELLAEITHTPLPNQEKTQSKSSLKSNSGVQQPSEKMTSSEDSESLCPKVVKDPVSQKVFNLAGEFYHQQLFEPEAKVALDYLIEKRGRDLETIKEFKIGFAKGGKRLYQFLKKQGFTDDELLKSKLVRRRNKRILDYFFGNIVLFPHFKDGNVIGFTIKDIGEYKSDVKLRLFSRDNFYNHDSLTQHQEIILVEGESDLHSIIQFTGQNNVIALCGNTLTQPQLRSLVDAGITKVYLCLDHDAAGRKATQKITEKLTAAGIAVFPVEFNCHKDIDLWLRFSQPKERIKKFSTLLKQAKRKNAYSKPPRPPQQEKSQVEPSTFDVIKELLKSVAILLALIFALLKQSKTYIRCRKNPQPKTRHYHPRPSFTVDEMPITETRVTVPHYTTLLEQYKQQYGKELKPVNRREGKRSPPPGAICGHCGAPYEYLSLNDGQKQVYCKVCKRLSNPDKQIKDVTLRCPHCGKTLEKMKKDTEKNGFLIYKCRNTNCPYFLKNQRKLKKLRSKKRKAKLKKLHYIYRKPIIGITSLHPASPDKPKVDLANVRSSCHVIGLVLTYRAYGLSTRLIATLMEEIHNVSLCHQTVKNYVDAAAYRLAPMFFNYPYPLSGIQTADETYIRLLAKWGYLCWSFDPQTQIITALNVSEKRNLIELAKAINHAISKFPSEVLTEDAQLNPLLVTDGNPVYKLITQFLRQAHIFINHKVVIGLENSDAESADFRNLKQIIERLHKNFKKFIHNSEYFGSSNGALSAALIFACHFNFIRKNPLLEGQIPVQIESVVTQTNQPSRWVRLLEYAQNYEQYR